MSQYCKQILITKQEPDVTMMLPCTGKELPFVHDQGGTDPIPHPCPNS